VSVLVCPVHDAETNRLIAMQPLLRSGDTTP
jgi:hypothetical protein